MECNCGDEINFDKDQNIIRSKYDMVDMDLAYIKIKEHFLEHHKKFKSDNNVVELNLSLINDENQISAENVFSPINVPSVNKSTMDGYAVNSKFIDISGEKEINVFQHIYADNKNFQNFDGTLNLKTDCVYVTTGSSIPPEFDCVIPIELAKQLTMGEINNVTSRKIKFIETGRNILLENNFIRRIGSDVKENELLLKKNDVITMTDVGVLISVGLKKVKLYRLPKIGIISTGDELIDYNNQNDNNDYQGVIDSNRILLQKLIKQHFPDIEIIDFGIANDDLTHLENLLDRVCQSECDILITSGGVSMGEKDLVKKLLETKGKIIFGRLNMKPGKPATFGSYKNLSVIALPGNPVSCVVCFYLLVCYSIKTFQNPFLETLPFHPFKKIKAKLFHDINLDLGRPEFARGVLYYNQEDNIFYVHKTGAQQSSRLNSFHKFNCLINLPKGSENKKKLHEFKEEVECLIIKVFNIIDKTQFDAIKARHNIDTTNNDDWIANVVKDLNKPANTPSYNKIYSVGTITVSDRAFKNVYIQDESTIAFQKYFADNLMFEVKDHRVVPDDKESIKTVLQEYADKEHQLILTSGGTGFSCRDVTPEVTKEFIDKEANSFSTFLTVESLKITKYACLSRNVVGIKNKSLIINLPGNPKAIRENLEIIKNVLPHALNQIIGDRDFH